LNKRHKNQIATTITVMSIAIREFSKRNNLASTGFRGKEISFFKNSETGKGNAPGLPNSMRLVKSESNVLN